MQSNSDKNSEGGKKRVYFIHSFFYQLSYQQRKSNFLKSGGVKTFLISKFFFYPCFLYPNSTVQNKKVHKQRAKRTDFSDIYPDDRFHLALDLKASMDADKLIIAKGSRFQFCCFFTLQKIDLKVSSLGFFVMVLHFKYCFQLFEYNNMSTLNFELETRFEVFQEECERTFIFSILETYNNTMVMIYMDLNEDNKFVLIASLEHKVHNCMNCYSIVRFFLFGLKHLYFSTGV